MAISLGSIMKTQDLLNSFPGKMSDHCKWKTFKLVPKGSVSLPFSYLTMTQIEIKLADLLKCQQNKSINESKGEVWASWPQTALNLSPVIKGSQFLIAKPNGEKLFHVLPYQNPLPLWLDRFCWVIQMPSLSLKSVRVTSTSLKWSSSTASG